MVANCPYCDGWRAHARDPAGVGRAVGVARQRRTRARGKESPDPLELARAAQKAVALAQQEKSTWTRAGLIKYLGRVLPRTGRDPAAAASLLEDLADRALRSQFEPVICLEAPDAVEVPRSMLRADGRSIYQRHGGIRYATRAQLAMEERLVAQAGAEAAPDPRRCRAGTRRRPGAARGHAGRTRARNPRSSSRTYRADCRSGRCCAVGTDRRQARLCHQCSGRVGQDAGGDRSRGSGRRPGGRSSGSRARGPPATPSPPGSPIEGQGSISFAQLFWTKKRRTSIVNSKYL